VLAWSEARLRALISGIPQLVWRADQGGDWLWSSPQWTDYTGLSAEASKGRGWLRAVHPEDSRAVSDAWTEAPAREGFGAECRLFDPKAARYRWFQNRATPVRDRNGRIVEWLGTSTDIDELLRMRDRQSALVGELQHRTRNLLGVVRSAAQRTMQSAGSLQEFSARFDRRLAALSRVQGLLSRSDDEAITIGGLVRMELEVAGAWAHRDRVAIGGPEVRLRNTTVQILALAIHELAANARQHGALASESGELEVRWQIAAPDGERRLVIDWVERGIDATAERVDPARRGLGRQLVERALPYSLGAETRFELREDGLRCTIALPIRMRGDQEVAG
jgi:two-component system, chemotaxis family, CheB/CheR fusion protein